MPAQKPSRRKSVDIEESEAHAAFKTLPPYQNQEYVTYHDMNMKHAPKWKDLVPYRQLIFKLLCASNGRSINQVGLLAHFKTWMSPEPINLQKAEESVYLVRCMINQIINHKNKDRQPPRDMRRAFGSIWELVAVEAENDERSDEDADAEIVAVKDAPKQPELVDLSEELQEPELADVLQDEDPELQRLLTAELDEPCPMGVLQDDDPDLQKLLTVDMDQDCIQ